MKYILTTITTFMLWYLIAAGFSSFVGMSNKFDITVWDEFYRGLWLIFAVAASVGSCCYLNMWK